MSVIFSGYYKKTIYKDYKTGFTKFLIHSYDTNLNFDEKGEVVCFGNIAQYCLYTPLKIEAELIQDQNLLYNNNKMYYKVIKIIEQPINERLTLLFIQNVCKGISSNVANTILEIAGNDVFEFVKKDNSVQILIDLIPELRKKTIIELINTIKNYEKERELLEYLSKLNGNYKETLKLIDTYGDDAINYLINNPYKCFNDMTIPFYICENIAKDKNVKEYEKDRIDALLYQGILSSIKQGNTFVTIDKLVEFMNQSLIDNIYTTKITKEFLCPYLDNEWLTIDNGNIYLKSKLEQEKKVASNIKRLLATKINLPFTEEIKNELVHNSSYALGSEQINSLDILKSSGIKILTGGPGTGKTTVIEKIIKGYKKMFPDAEITLADRKSVV